MAPKINLRSQSKRGVKKVQTKRHGGSISAFDSKRRRTSRQLSKAEMESTKLPSHVPLSSPPYEMASDAPRERLFKDADIFKARAHSFGNPIEANKVIKSVLTDDQLEKYRQTCFGHLLEVENLRFSGHIVHNLLCRQVVSNDHQALEFNFGRSGVRFTKWEFALITGLKFCQYPSMNDIELNRKSKELCKRLLEDRSDLKPPELDRIFKHTDFVDDWDAVRIALLYFLVHGVLGMDPRVQINRKFIELVADIEVFNSYPWGIPSYKETIESLHNAFHHRGCEIKNNSQSYDLKGFPLAFQVWAFEAIPEFGKHFGERRETRCPRMVGWHATTQPSHFAVQCWFTSNIDYVAHWRLNATDEEKNMDYWRSIAVNIHEVRYTEPPLVAPIASDVAVDAKDASKAEKQSNAPPDDNVARLEAKLDELKKFVVESREEDRKEIASLRNMLTYVTDLLKHKSEHHMHTQPPPSSVRPSSPLVASYGEQEEEFDAPIDGSSGKKMDEDCKSSFDPIISGGPYVEDSWALVPYRPLQLGRDFTASADSPHHNPFVDAESKVEAQLHKFGEKSRFNRVYQQSHHLTSPFIVSCKRKVKLNLKRPIDASKERSFDEWYRLAPAGSSVCASYMTVNKKFFDDLLTPAGWLTSDHMDTILYFIRRRRFEHQSSFTQNCAIMDTLFWLYVPINNSGVHWLAAIVDLKARHVELYDPNMGNKYVQNREIKNAKCLTCMLPYLLREGEYYDKNPDVLPSLEPFTMAMIKDAPRQDNGGDCGVFTLKFIEYKSSEEDVLFGPDDISWFRKKYAVDVYFNKFSM
ncbi:uncharacterized protein LOC107419213 isoform X2 [Ziziphus jujuba]|uniref:Uncharacterized protein LOC107419213 isoform X2 n=1 Tax=Ziziphus jujuba TaxID=326968 RepID=A0ABM3IJY9_ZIZJJ|nr:uncharacterized protein LOC107419213 isoform X2 [Ziziphus jujuba]